MDFQVPELGEGIYEAELVRWLVKPGDQVKRSQPLVEVMTDKATMEVPSPFAGTIRQVHGEPGQVIKVGSVLLSYDPAGEQPATASPQAPARPAPTAPTDGAAARPRRNAVAAAAPAGPIKAAPSVRLMARKLGLDLGTIHGSGPHGRILIDDIAAQAGHEPRKAPAQQRDQLTPRFDLGKPGTRIKLQGLRRKIAEHMVLSKQTIPHYSYVDECDATDLVHLRDSLRDTYRQMGIKLTYLAFVVKAVVGALKEVPLVNATLNEQDGEIVLHDHYHIGIAVATEGGLIVPVVHDADRKDLGQLAREIERLGDDTRAGKARREDLKGSTFTVTSIGNIGGLFSAPIINHPEVGILGFGKIIRRPVYDASGNIRPADLVYLSFSFDHRVVDGAVGAVFANAVIRRLGNPATLLLPLGQGS
jgi:pyruvate dehydrogenase E2 component (dihydrolipoamide acetyltransferase)/2-oxoisovalerate dehydrogenase E2 component (dihydrolipoyl transacylase)